MGLVWGLYGLKYEKFLKQSLVHSKSNIFAIKFISHIELSGIT